MWCNRVNYENYEDWNASRDNITTRVAAAHIERFITNWDTRCAIANPIAGIVPFNYRTWLVSDSLRSSLRHPLCLRKFSKKKEFYEKEFYTPQNLYTHIQKLQKNIDKGIVCQPLMV